MTTAAAPHIEIFTDGACSGNPGPGGWGAVLRHKDTEKELSGGEPATTNNRMEMMAAIMALEALKRPSTVALYTYSNYLRDGTMTWIHGGKRTGRRQAATKTVKTDAPRPPPALADGSPHYPPPTRQGP